MKYDIEPFVRRFGQYAASFAAPGAELAFAHRLKIKPTMEVLDFARRIMRGEGVTDRRSFFTGELAALFHDLARFRQYERFHTFRDNPEFNHGHAAADMLETGGWLEGVDPAIAAEAVYAVRHHNARTLPDDLPPEYAFTAKLVRDADKLSIYHVVLDYFRHRDEYDRDPAVSLELPETPAVSRELIALIRRGETGDYRKLACVNDFLVNLFGWINDFNFPAAKKLLIERNIFPQLRELLPPDAELDALCRETVRRAADGGKAP